MVGGAVGARGERGTCMASGGQRYVWLADHSGYLGVRLSAGTPVVRVSKGSVVCE